jgi:hypothetical protein
MTPESVLPGVLPMLPSMLATNCLYSASSITPSTLRGQDGITTNNGNTAGVTILAVVTRLLRMIALFASYHDV